MRQMNKVTIIIMLFILVLVLSCSKKDVRISSKDGVNISYNIYGDGDIAILCVHGWGNNRSIWDFQIPHFSKNYKFVTVDLPGFGKSGNGRTNWTMKAFGEDVVEVINGLELDKVVLVGFSMGGPVVMEAEKLISDKVLGVVLVDNTKNPDNVFPAHVIEFMDSVMMDLVTNPTLDKMIKGGFIKQNPEESFKRILTMIKDVPKIGWRESMHDIFRWHNEDKKRLLEECKAPIVGINSDVEPVNIDGIKELAPSFKNITISNTGHVIMWDATDAFNQNLNEAVQTFINK